MVVVEAKPLNGTARQGPEASPQSCHGVRRQRKLVRRRHENWSTRHVNQPTQTTGLRRRDSHGHDPGSNWDPVLHWPPKRCNPQVNLIDETHQLD